MPKVRRALLSVSDKTGLVEFAQALRKLDVELLSSGGTAALMAENGIDVTKVSDYTGFPEILDGRVKTLHPRVFAGILARDTPAHAQQLEQHEIGAIELVVVNLYPFEQTISRGDVSIEQAVEKIDIGGPSMVRAAAKSHERVAVVVDPADYPQIIADLEANDGEVSPQLRQSLAGRAFQHTAAYDAAISNYFARQAEPDAWPESLSIPLQRVQSLRYGENPHQTGAFYAQANTQHTAPKVRFEQLQGKELSYNNIVDADAAWNLARELPGVGVCVIKHTNPCGAASADDGDVAEVFARALEGDPVSAFGGIVSCNRTVTATMAQHLREIFLEAVIAPDFDADALQILGKKKKLRLLRVDPQDQTRWVWRVALGGVLVQDEDTSAETVAEGRVVTEVQPSEQQMADLQFGWVVCKHVKSNAIVYVKDRQLVGVGAGQMSRVDSVRLAATKARAPLEGSVMASDAFFPFRDALDEAVQAGVRAIVQPGGSIRDEDAIAAANEHGVPMVFTGFRHFRH